jgi:addiction module HigA family antidote
MATMRPVHPGRILKRELAARKLSETQVAKSLRVRSERLAEILSGRRNITPSIARRLACFFGNESLFWMNLQRRYVLRASRS